MKRAETSRSALLIPLRNMAWAENCAMRHWVIHVDLPVYVHEELRVLAFLR